MKYAALTVVCKQRLGSVSQQVSACLNTVYNSGHSVCTRSDFSNSRIAERTTGVKSRSKACIKR